VGGELGGEEDGGIRRYPTISFSKIKKLCTCISIKKGTTYIPKRNSYL
jgi:hypothetical protein